MRILVTGAAGFIGGAFARRAAAGGHHVAGLVRPGGAPPPPAPNIRWFSGSLADAPWPELAAFRPEACVHAAWIATPGVYLEAPENERLMESSLAFLRRAAGCGVRHLLALGTCLEYKMTGEALSESATPLEPAFLYARCKDALRRGLEREAGAAGFSLCWGRVFYPYGPGEHPARLCSSIVRTLRDGGRVVLQNPESAKDYIFIDDLAAAMAAIVERKASGAVNLGTGSTVTVMEMARTLAQILGRPGRIDTAEATTPDPLGRVAADSSRLRALGWRPQVSIPEGLGRLVRQ